MSSETWTLEPNAEREYLLPWLEAEPEADVRQRVTRFIAGLLIDPDRPGLYDEDADAYSVDAVPGTHVGLVWLLKAETRELVLAHVG